MRDSVIFGLSTMSEELGELTMNREDLVIHLKKVLSCNMNYNISVDESVTMLMMPIDIYFVEKYNPLQDQYLALLDDFNTLIFAVESKFPGESRHETALRYIRQAEQNEMLRAIPGEGKPKSLCIYDDKEECEDDPECNPSTNCDGCGLKPKHKEVK